MTTFEYKGKTAYIDERLKYQLDTVILPELSKKDKDVVFIVDGKERSGKSKFADILGGYAASQLKTEYDINNICMTPESFRNRIQNAGKNDIVIYDEAHRGMGSRRALSEINNMLIDLMMEMGQKNLFVIIVLPTIFMLDRYPALFRARGLFHIYENKGQRGFWVYFNEIRKKELYLKGKKLLDYNCMKWPKFRGRFYNQYIVDEAEYRAKKGKAFNDKPRITKAESFKAQRDTLFYILYHHFELTELEISKLCKKNGFKIERNTISMALTEINANPMNKTEIKEEIPLESVSVGE